VKNDGVENREYDLTSLKEYISQELIPFNCSTKENIRMGLLTDDESTIISAAKETTSLVNYWVSSVLSL
jgi:ABC-type multidrug transport system fused ATPase/permease subunit